MEQPPDAQCQHPDPALSAQRFELSARKRLLLAARMWELAQKQRKRSLALPRTAWVRAEVRIRW